MALSKLDFYRRLWYYTEVTPGVVAEQIRMSGFN